MSRNALSLEAFDPDVLDAARDVARRAGVPLETWIESVVSAPDKTENTRRKRPAASEDAPARPAGTRAKASASAPRATAEPPRASADPFVSSISAMMQRLDALDRSLAEDRRSSEDAANRAIAALESRISALPAGDRPAGEMIERLADIERRMGELQTHLAKPRPVGRRGRPLVEEVRDAVEEVRQRQRELASGGDAGVVARRRADEPSPVFTELQAETSRLRESLGSLATGRDVSALEQAMRELATDVQRAREPADLAAIATPMERMRAQVERLADEIADNVHARISGDVERIAGKVDGALRTSSPSLADRDALDHVFSELDEIRRQIGALAGPERIQSLAQGLQAISGQIAQLQGGRGPGMDELRPILEEIRKGLKSPDTSTAILGRIDALADKMDRVNVNPVGELIGRLEDLGESLRRPSAQEGDLAAIQKMLRGLAEKVDHVRAGGNGESLDALEKQVVAIARRLDARGNDPAIASLERMMGDLLMQVSALRDEGSVEAAVERATRRAVEQAMASDRGVPSTGGVDLLRNDLAELCAQQAAADQRMHSTMDALNLTLERIVERLDRPTAAEASRSASVREDSGSLAEHLRASTASHTAPTVEAPSARTARRPEAPRAAQAAAAPARDELLEPGSSRPAQSQPAQARASRSAPSEPPAALGGDIKANFIAAARRAAQAAQADIDGPATTGARTERARVKAAAPDTAGRASGLLASLRGAIDKRRRPLLLGLAAVVLVIGAYHAFDLGSAPEAPSQAAATPTPIVGAPKATESPAIAEATPAAKGETAKPDAPKAIPGDPQTTQSIASAPDSAAKPASQPDRISSFQNPPAPSVIPKVASMDSLKADLASVPAGLASLKQAALEGDGAAIFELATRESDGRGMPRDLALAAKLYEKLAGAGYAPAQFKIGSFYEKGSGVIKDLAQAKSWYEKAAGLGNIRSMHNLAVLHAENPAANGKPDFATAASWFRRGAEYGVRDSQYNLAVLYARGLGVGQDLVQSYAWFSAAAAQGDEEAAKKREDVAAKLDPKALATAKSVASAYKPKLAETAANDMPAPKAAGPAPMSLLGAPPPGAPTSTFTPPGRRVETRAPSTGI